MAGPLVFDVPAGTPARTCGTCRAEVYWIITAAGKRMPVDVGVPEGLAPSPLFAGCGISHFATCQDADYHRRPRAHHGRAL